MKRVLSFLVVLFLLCSCASNPVQPSAVPDVLDNKRPLDNLGAFYDTCIPLPEAEGEPTVYSLDGDLLFLYMRYTSEEECTLQLYRLNTYSGEIVSKATIPSKGYGLVQIYGDTVCLTSPPSGKVWFLNTDLQISVEYSFLENYNEWYISADMRTLFQIGWDNGITSFNLADGKMTQILPATSDVSGYRKNGNAISFSYVDPDSQMTCGGILDLANSQFRKLDVEGSLISYDPGSGIWLSNLYFDEVTCFLGGTGEGMRVFDAPDTSCALTDQGQILLRNYVNGNVGLYTAEGNLISRLQLPVNAYGPAGYLADSMVWDATRGGYFVIYTTFSDPVDTEGMEAETVDTPTLAFWDLNAKPEGSDLTLRDYAVGSAQGGSATEQAVYWRAEDIAKRYGVRVLVADQCLTRYDSFETQTLVDPDAINVALTELERALKKYPEGFFAQLRYNSIKELEFSIVGELTPLREDEFGSVAAFAQEMDYKYIIVANGHIASDMTFHHELSHVIDHRLQWDADHREGALYSEESWAALNPKNFSYDMTYALHHDRWNYNEKYFISSYSCTYPTEDRATVWEQIMVGNTYPYEEYAPLREKLEYYSKCIRDCFDTTGWPSIMPWEKGLS